MHYITVGKCWGWDAIQTRPMVQWWDKTSGWGKGWGDSEGWCVLYLETGIFN